MSDAKTEAPAVENFEYGSLRWKLLGIQLARYMGITNRELVDFGNELSLMIDENYKVSEADRMHFSIELCQGLRDAFEKIMGRHLN